MLGKCGIFSFLEFAALLGLAAGCIDRKVLASPLRSLVDGDDVAQGLLRSERFLLKPLFGVLEYDDGLTLDRRTRALFGASFHYNAARIFNPDWLDLYIGPFTGVLFSGAQGGNIWIVPTDLQVGYAFTDRLRVAVHAGGNVVYRTSAWLMNLDPLDRGTDPLWKYYPNAGLDLDLGLGHGAVVNLHPDWTFAMNDTFFIGTAGIGLMF